MCFVAVVYYFIVYPILVARRRKKANLQEVKLPPSIDYNLEWDKIKGVGAIFADTFAILRGSLGRVFYLAALFAGLSTWRMMWYNNGKRYFILDAAPEVFYQTGLLSL